MGRYEPQRLNDRHKEALRLLVGCLSLTEISEFTGLSPWTISKVSNSRKGRAYVQALQEKMDDLSARATVHWMLTGFRGSIR